MKTTVFSDGRTCQAHIVNLLSQVDFSNPNDVDQQTVVERKVLKALWSAMMFRWPESDNVLSNTQAEILTIMNEFLEQDTSGQDDGVGAVVKASNEDVVAVDNEENAQEGEDDHQNEDKPQLLRRSIIIGRRGPSPHIAPAMARKRRREYHEYDDSDQDDAPVHPQHALARLKKELNQRFRAESEARARLEDAIQQERREWREERQEFHNVLSVMTETLKSERSAQHDETKSMLELIEKEREGRRSEFVPMMDLVTNTVLQPSSARRGKVVENGIRDDSEPTGDGRM